MQDLEIERLVLVCLGGAVGTGVRYLVSLSMLSSLGPGFPWATLTVNIVGSFLLGASTQLASSGAWMSPTASTVLATGVLGGFTTYSAFNQETLAWLAAGELQRAGGYVAVTLSACLCAGWSGRALARALGAA